MTPEYYPSVSIVAGSVILANNPVGVLDHQLKMHGGAMYITISADVARQWITVLEPIAEEGMK